MQVAIEADAAYAPLLVKLLDTHQANRAVLLRVAFVMGNLTTHSNPYRGQVRGPRTHAYALHVPTPLDPRLRAHQLAQSLRVDARQGRAQGAGRCRAGSAPIQHEPTPCTSPLARPAMQSAGMISPRTSPHLLADC